MKAKARDGEFEKVEAGLHKARCVRIIDRGSHKSELFGNYNRQLMIMFELPEALIKEGELKGEPFSMCIFPNLTIGKKSNLRAFLVGWLGRSLTLEEDEDGYDVMQLLDRPAFLNIIHGEKYANVQSISPLPEQDCPDRIGDLVKFDLDSFDQQVFDGLSEKMQEYIKLSREWDMRFAKEPAGDTAKAINEANKQIGLGNDKMDFSAEFKALPKKTFDAVMKLCSKTMGRADFVSWFTDNGYPSPDKITNTDQQMDIARALKALCEKRVVDDIPEQELPF